MPYYSETDKIREILHPMYLDGAVLDMGCGNHKIKPAAVGVDGRKLDGVDIHLANERDIYMLSYREDIGCDYHAVFSSHCLEHLRNPTMAIDDWSRLIKKGGYLILYLPDRNRYSNEGNLEHMYDWDLKSFLFYFQRCFCGIGKNYKGENFTPTFKVLECDLDSRLDCYSFYVVAQKL